MKVLMIIVVLITVMVLFMVIKNMKTPSGLGVNQGQLAPLPKSPNAVSSLSEDPEKKVDPISFKGDINESKEWIKKALEAYGSISIVKEDVDYIHAVDTTGTMKYHDDIEFYFDKNELLIHFRSASRVGYSDMGLNRERYNKLVKLLN